MTGSVHDPGGESPGRPPIRALVVDDSAVVRQALSQILARAGMAVATAADPIIAMEMMRSARPDVLILDLEMPRMNGLTFLRRIMGAAPLPVVVCSGRAGPGTESALHALEEGAVEIIAKPELGVKEFLHGSADRLAETVRAAAHARVRRPERAGAPPLAEPHARAAPPPARAGGRLVAVGASTGGTEALRLILEAMPASAPAIVVVQHMPEVYTAAFARRLARSCRIEVKEAAQSDRLLSGRALIAPGNHHLLVRRSGEGFAVDVMDGPPVNRHRPSVDALFRSVARCAGVGAVGVLLTGMGHDGAAGLLEMRRAGASTMVQDEETSVVFGMPREAILLGAAAEVLPLPLIAAAILRRAA